MKKILLSFCIILQLSAFAQIPNNGFENWTNKGSYQDPQGWWVTNDSVKSGSYYPVTQSTDHYPVVVGSYSIRIESQIYAAFPPPLWQDLGMAGTGDWNILKNDYPAFPVTGHPTSLCGYYKWLPQNGDTMNISIRLYKNGVDIAGGRLEDSTSKTNWASFQIPFSSYSSADSGRINMSCTADKNPVSHGSSVLYVDNLSFDVLITGTPQINNQASISIYPNPTTDAVNISFTEKYSGLADIGIYDITGRMVLSQHAILKNDNIMKIAVKSLYPGVYLLKVNTEKGSSIDKFIKE